MKKITLVITLILTLLLSSCATGEEELDETVADKEETTLEQEETQTTVTEAVENVLKIAILTCPSGVDDGSFNRSTYEGILKFLQRYPNAIVSEVQSSATAPKDAVKALENIVKDHDIFVLPGYQFSEIGYIALENLDKKFILIDAQVKGKKQFANVKSLIFKEEESGFLAGVAAASETKTGKVAVVGGVPFPSNVNYQYGFMAGVNYSNKKYGTNAQIIEVPEYAGIDVTGKKIGGNYTGNFDDTPMGKFLGQALVNVDVDIILVAAGNSGYGVFSAVKEVIDDRYVIGCDVDQYDDGDSGEKNIVKTSAIKAITVNVEKALQSVVDGNFKAGTTYLGASSESTGLVLENGRHQLSDTTVKRVKECYKLLQLGRVVPPSNFNGSTPDDFKGLN